MIKRIEGEEELYRVQRSILVEVGVDVDSNFGTYFGNHITVAGISSSQIEDLRDYRAELSVRDGYLHHLHDWYRKNVDRRIDRPALKSGKSGIIWTLASYATAAHIIRGADQDLTRVPAASEVFLVSELHPKQPRDGLGTEITLRLLSDRQVLSGYENVVRFPWERQKNSK